MSSEQSPPEKDVAQDETVNSSGKKKTSAALDLSNPQAKEGSESPPKLLARRVSKKESDKISRLKGERSTVGPAPASRFAGGSALPDTTELNIGFRFAIKTREEHQKAVVLEQRRKKPKAPPEQPKFVGLEHPQIVEYVQAARKKTPLLPPRERPPPREPIYHIESMTAFYPEKRIRDEDIGKYLYPGSTSPQHWNLFNIALMLGKNAQVKKCANEVVQYAMQLEYRPLIGRAYYWIARAAEAEEDWHEAADYFWRALPCEGRYWEGMDVKQRYKEAEERKKEKEEADKSKREGQLIQSPGVEWSLPAIEDPRYLRELLRQEKDGMSGLLYDSSELME